MSRRALLRLSVAVMAVAAAAMTGAPDASADVVGVAVSDRGFMPPKVEVHTGDTVAFIRTRDAKLPHSVTSQDNAFPDQDLSNKPYVGLQFNQPGTYPYYCRYQNGMSGVVVVSDPAPSTTSSSTSTTQPPSSSTSSSSTTTTSTTRPPTTTTTRPPTPTTTRPPATAGTPPPATAGTTTSTTVPPTTATTGPTINGRPMGSAPAPSPTTEPPRAPAAAPGPKKPADSTTSTSPAKAAPASGNSPSSSTETTGAIAMPPPPDLAITAPDAPTTPTTAPAPPAVKPVELRDMEAVAGGRADKPVDDGSGLLLVVGGALGVIGVVSAVWAWYHRPSRYLPA